MVFNTANWYYAANSPSSGIATDSKKILTGTLIALQTALIAVRAAENTHADGWTIAGAAAQLTSAVCLLPLSFLEHGRTVRPSMLITVSVLTQTLLDAAPVRTAWLIAGKHSPATVARLSTAVLAVRALVLLAETRRKTRWLRWNVDEHSPEETSGIIGLSVFLWLNRLFVRGYRGLLAVESLYPLDAALRSPDLQRKLDAALSAYPRGARLGLARALARAFPVPLLVPVLPRLALIGLTFAQPFFVQALLRHLQRQGAPPSHGYALVAASGLIFGGAALARALYCYSHGRFLCMVRGGLSAALYAGTSRARLVGGGGAGAAVTLVSTDTERVVKGLDAVHELWACAVEVAIGSWLLHRQIGPSFAAPFALLLASVVVVGGIGRRIGRRQASWVAQVQRRVGATTDAVAGMMSVRLGGLAEVVGRTIRAMRAEELAAGNAFRWLFVVTVVASIAPAALSPLFVLALAPGGLDATGTFTALSFVVLLTTPLVQGIRAVPKVVGAFACLARIQAFLEEPGHVDYRWHGKRLTEVGEKNDRVGTIRHQSVLHTASPRIVVVEDGSFGWAQDNMVLKNLDVSFPASKLTVVVGPTASGKSTLCKALIGETPFAKGRTRLLGPRGPVGFCDSTPFLCDTTIRKNIVGRAVFNNARYQDVLDACVLRADLLALAHGDETSVGSDGSNLSGGQRQRVALARALYLETDLVIVDDVVKALDNDTAGEMMRRLFGQDGLLRRRNVTVILCTHSALPLAYADHVITLGADGTVAEQGALSDVMFARGQVASLAGGKALAAPVGDPEVDDAHGDRRGTSRPARRTERSTATGQSSRQHGDLAVYRHYLRSISVGTLAASAAGALLLALAGGFGTLWLRYWAQDALRRSRAFYAGIYALAQGAQMLAALCTCAAVAISATTRSGGALHDEALSAVLRAPPGRLGGVGAVTTLFAQDMTLVDGELPLALLNVLVNVFDVAVASPWLALGYPPVAGLLWAVQRFYLRTSRQLRLLDLETKGPLITHFLDTARGLATIRAFGWTVDDAARGHGLLTDSQRPAYLLSMIRGWLVLTLDLVVAVAAATLSALATQTRSDAGFTGASLVMLMTLSQVVARLMRFYTELETSIGAVARIKAFSEGVPREPARGEGDVVPPPSWPAAGLVRLSGVSAAYRSGDEEGGGRLALKDVTLAIQPGQKVAICGRTGSGKSSLILLLTRLLDPLDECRDGVEIEGLGLGRIDREVVRQRVLAVPQDAVFLPAGSSVKDNLDIADGSTDAECEEVLRAVGLHQAVAAHAETGTHSELRPEELSAGQKQLFGLARVVLRRRARDGRGGVLLLDELSAGVDMETERTMQEVVRREFGGYTVLAVSHRLSLVAEYHDLVVVMDGGCVAERGDPRALMAEEDSRFARLLRLEGE